jgi:serine/threonine-protein kinase
LGKGATGRVWRVRNATLATDVAVKFFAFEGAQQSEARERFEREARAAAKIKSPHIMQSFDQGVLEDGTPYIVMELLEGETLRARMERKGVLEMRLARTVINQLAKGIHSAHAAGVVHRDLKPENVFIADTSSGLLVKIFDFGVAKQSTLPLVDRLTIEGAMIGTPQYMSPEQVMNSRMVDHRADLWALAVITYEMLTGQVPFRGHDIGALCAAHRQVRSCYLLELGSATGHRWLVRARIRSRPQQAVHHRHRHGSRVRADRAAEHGRARGGSVRVG